MARFPQFGSMIVYQTGAALAMCCAFTLTQPCLAGTPENDDCVTASIAVLGDNLFNTVDGNVALPAACVSISHDIWFKFTSTFTGSLEVSTCNNANFDTVLSVYSGCGCGSYTLLGCNDDVNNECFGGSSKLKVNVAVGKCYRIRLGGFNGAQGIGTLVLKVGSSQNAAGANRIVTGQTAGDRLGTSVAGNALINIDVQKDVLVGAARNGAVGVEAGRAYAYTGPDLTTLYTKSGAAAGDNFGSSVALTDVTDDGRDELVIGAPKNDGSGVEAGRVYVYKATDGLLLWEAAGLAAGDQFGFCVRAAGDANGDGINDVLVGAPNADPNGADSGQAYVLSGIDGSILLTISGLTAGDLFGSAVAGVGDLDGNGTDDFAVGSPKYDGSKGVDSGRITLYSGTDGTAFKSINGEKASDRFGSAIAGRLYSSSGNTHSFIAIGAPYSDAAGKDSGRVRVYKRNVTNPAASGCSSFVCLQFTINGGNAGDRFGTALEVADIVGSVTPEIIAGAPTADLNGSSSGAAYVFNGATGVLAKKYFGEAPGDRFGTALALAGDVNNDQDDDLIVGAPLNDAGGDTAGRAYTFFIDDGNVNLSAPDDFSFPDPVLDIPNLADLDGNNIVDADDLMALLNAWGPCLDHEDCPADLVTTGVIDLDDLLMLLSNWTD